MSTPTMIIAIPTIADFLGASIHASAELLTMPQPTFKHFLWLLRMALLVSTLVAAITAVLAMVTRAFRFVKGRIHTLR